MENLPRLGDVASREVDYTVPALLQEFMVQGWGPPAPVDRPRVTNRDERRGRRRRLSEHLAGVLLLVPNGVERIRSNDTAFRFRPASNFVYLVGEGEQGDVLALVPTSKGEHEPCLYTASPSSWTDPNVISDRISGALWAMPRLSLRDTAERYGVETARLDDLPKLVSQYQSTAILRGVDGAVDGMVAPKPELDRALATVLADMRLVKSASEIAELANACRLTAEAFDRVARHLHRLRTEREVEVVFDSWARNVGAGTGYLSIVAAGANATVRHNSRNQGPLRAGDLLLLDAGVETQEYYTADVTRTLPIREGFNSLQRDVYNVVSRAHQAAVAATKPGVPFRHPHDVAMLKLCEGLRDMGILKMSAEEAADSKRQFYRRYCRHGTSHMLGIDVHDCADASVGRYRDGTLEPGMVLTIEPGLYLQPHDLTIPQELRGIGVRIEDDIVVTPSGSSNLSQDIPAALTDIERWTGSRVAPAAATWDELGVPVARAQ